MLDSHVHHSIDHCLVSTILVAFFPCGWRFFGCRCDVVMRRSIFGRAAWALDLFESQALLEGSIATSVDGGAALPLDHRAITRALELLRARPHLLYLASTRPEHAHDFHV